MGMIKKMFGKDLKVQEIISLGNKKLNDFLKEQEDLQIVGEVMPQDEAWEKIDWRNDQEFELVYEVGFAPDFSIDTDKLAVKQYTINVEDSVIDEHIDNLKKRFAEPKPVETLEGELSQHSILAYFMPGNEQEAIDIEEAEENGKVFKIDVELSKLKPEGADLFVGKSKEETLKLDLNDLLPEDQTLGDFFELDQEELEAKGGTQGILTIASIVHTQPVEVDQDFIDKVLGQGEYDMDKAQDEEIEDAEVIEEEEQEESDDQKDTTSQSQEEEQEEEKEEKERIEGVEAFREELRKRINEELGGQTEMFLQQMLELKLYQEVEIDLPDEFLKRWLLQSNDDNEELTPEVIEEQYPYFRDELKASLIFNRIAKEQEIKVEQQDMLDTAKEIVGQQFMQMGMDINQFGDELGNQFADEYLKRDNGKNVSQVVSQTVRRKAMDWLAGQVNKEVETVTLKDFEKVVDEFSKQRKARYEPAKAEA